MKPTFMAETLIIPVSSDGGQKSPKIAGRAVGGHACLTVSPVLE